MENKEQAALKGAQARLLTDDDLAQTAGGVGYSSIKCKKCGKTFSDMDQYRKHIEAGCGKALICDGAPQAHPGKRRR